MWEMVYVVFYDHVMNEVNKFTKKKFYLRPRPVCLFEYAGKPVFGRSNQVGQKPGCVAAEV